jgi:hypothetical protein
LKRRGAFLCERCGGYLFGKTALGDLYWRCHMLWWWGLIGTRRVWRGMRNV